MAKKPGKKKLKQNDGSLPSGVLDAVGYKAQTYRIGVIFGLSIGGLTLLTGVLLLILGFNGNIEWVVTGTANFTSRLKNASPGIVIGIIGAAIVIYYKPRNSHEATFDRQRSSAPTVHASGGSWHSVSTYRERGVGTVSERVTYRHEERGAGSAPENRSMDGHIQHATPRYERKG